MKELKKAFELPTPEQLVIDPDDYGPRSVEELESEINADAQVLFQQQRMFRPLWPWVFVYVLPREQQVGSILIPEHEQNKTVHEGIVLATWRPGARTVRWTKGCHVVCEECKHWTPVVQGDMEMSELKMGDHVLFPHWSGVPVSGYDTGRYRCVREIGEGCIQGVIEYADESVIDKLAEELWDLDDDNHTSRDVAVKLSERFILVDRKASSVTLSGR